METYIIHPESPEKRFIQKSIQFLQRDGLLLCPTDSGYSLICSALSKKALNKLYKIKKPYKKFTMTLMVPSFNVLTEFAHLDKKAFKFIKPLIPGKYTFILPATHIGKKLLDVRRPEVGVRFPLHPFIQGIFDENPFPLLSTSAQINDEDVFSHPNEIANHFSSNVDLIIDAGIIPLEPTTVVSFLEEEPVLIREGAGPIEYQ